MTAVVPVLRNEDAPLVSLATGDLAAMIRLDGVDDRNRLLWYVIRLAGARANVNGRIMGALSDGTQIELGRLDVAPGAIGESRFAVVQPRGRPFAHVYLDLRSADLALRVQAPPAPPRRPSHSLRIGTALVLAGVLVSAGACAATAIPRPPTIAAPNVAPAGEAVHIGYAARSFGHLRYTAMSDDGRVVASAPLTASQGDLSLTFPRRLSGRRVSLRIDTDGPFGRASNAVTLAVVPPIASVPSGPVARIATFTARREGSADNESVLASYLAVADGGVLVVSDGARRVLGKAPFSHGGTTRIALLPGARGAALTVRMDVRRGSSRASAALGLAAPAVPPSLGASPSLAAPPTVALERVDPPPTTDDAPVSADDPAAPVAADDAPFALSGRAVAGRAMSILVRRAMPGMRLSLADDAGTPVGDAAVPPGARTVALTPPAATVWRTYFLSCTYGSGNAEETVVRTVRVSPR